MVACPETGNREGQAFRRSDWPGDPEFTLGSSNAPQHGGGSWIVGDPSTGSYRDFHRVPKYAFWTVGSALTACLSPSAITLP